MFAGILQADPYRDSAADAFAATAILREQIRRGHDGHRTKLQFWGGITKNEAAGVPFEVPRIRPRTAEAEKGPGADAGMNLPRCAGMEIAGSKFWQFPLRDGYRM